MDKSEGLDLAKQLSERLWPGEWRSHDLMGNELCAISGSYPLAIFGPKITDRLEAFLALNCAVGTGLPVTSALYEFINSINSDAWLGSCHLMEAQDGSVTTIYSLIVPLEPISWSDAPSVRWPMTMVNSVMLHARGSAPDLISRFGGRPFSPQAVDTLILMT